MSSSWTSATPSTKQPQPATPHVCIGGLAISTCAQCAGHPQGEADRDAVTAIATPYANNAKAAELLLRLVGNHMEAYELDFRGFGGDDEEEEPKGKSRQKTGRNNKDQS
ncbi:hypothetical protein B0J12DRAFT_702837 [Macrophomina phaseolina]|uniref:Uncharacterized protein n=1 Tax=Macrophomina phaseolina TaxID=35725 RepID=A0ABQ8G0I9_9PEZI|nr:hypothetical protein B0J12DRAFT_702837 [Macrophomina phaseolina]